MKNFLEQLKKDNISGVSAMMIVLLGFVYIFCITFFNSVAEGANMTENRTGVLALMMIAVNYLVGSSRGSQMKDEHITSLNDRLAEKPNTVTNISKVQTNTMDTA